MRVLSVTGSGRKISRDHNLLRITAKDDDPVMITPHSLERLILEGDHAITTGAVDLLLGHGVDVAFLDWAGRPIGHLLPFAPSSYTKAEERQRDLSSDRSIAIASAIVGAVLHNRREVLMERRRARSEVHAAVAEIDELATQIPDAKSLDELRGIEGAAAHAYFSAIAAMVPAEIEFSGRVRNPALDPINALLNYGYGILYTSVRRAIVRAGLSPFYGTLHASYKRQEALVYDLVEEFRQPVVDHAVLAMVGRREVNPALFAREEGMCMIPPNLKKTYVAAIFSRLSDQAKYGGGRCEFSRIIEMQAKKMAECLMEERDYTPFRYHRL